MAFLQFMFGLFLLLASVAGIYFGGHLMKKAIEGQIVLKQIEIFGFSFGKKNNDTEPEKRVVYQQHAGSGDNVAGDKFELSNPTEYVPLNSMVKNELAKRINAFAASHQNIQLNILFQFFTTDEGTRRFAYEFKDTMETFGITVHVVPIQLVGGPQSPSGFHFKFKKLIYEDAITFLKCVEVLFSTKNGQIVVPKPREVDDIGEFNILIQVVKQIYFDSDGKVFFSR